MQLSTATESSKIWGKKIEIAKKKYLLPARLELAALGLWDCFGTTKSYKYETYPGGWLIMGC
jgi:hypothetical protein